MKECQCAASSDVQLHPSTAATGHCGVFLGLRFIYELCSFISNRVERLYLIFHVRWVFENSLMTGGRPALTASPTPHTAASWLWDSAGGSVHVAQP